MSVIVIPATCNHKLHHAQFHSNTSAIPAALSVGEILETRVIEKLGARNVLIALRGVKMPATSEVTLHVGDTITVKVESLYPHILLRIVGGTGAEAFKVEDYLKWQRANPDALSHMISEAFALLNGTDLGNITRYLSEENLQQLARMFKLLVLSPDTKGGNFIKDFLGNLGVLTESQLRKTMERGSGISDDYKPQNLKGLLMKLSEEIQNLFMKRETLDHEAITSLTKLTEFVDASVKTIESQQIMNFMLQEAENKYLFQIPVLFPDSIERADIFVECDQAGRNGRRKGCYRIVFFLNMDILGDMIIEATMEGNMIGCLIKCGDQEICEFVSSFLEELRNALAASGCKINRVTCIAGNDLAEEKREYYQERILYSREAVDVFV